LECTLAVDIFTSLSIILQLLETFDD
jgi:hypothetical protein